MDTVELEIPVADDEQADMLTAELAELPFESFVLEDGVLRAYMPAALLPECRERTEALLSRFGIGGARYATLCERNWNALWESGFTPVEVAGRLRIRASHHAPAPSGVVEVIVTPQLAFGTGHHVTTRLMATALLDGKPVGLEVLDMGCGTGVLAILAVKLGAKHADAVDIDSWSQSNCRSNCTANGVADRVTALLGDVRCIEGRSYDLVLANINRNTLLADMAAYAAALRGGGTLWMSGFLEEDAPLVEDAARRCGLTPAVRRVDGGWAAVCCVREGR